MASSSMATQDAEARTESTMMAWRVHEFGLPQVMQFEASVRLFYRSLGMNGMATNSGRCPV